LDKKIEDFFFQIDFKNQMKKHSNQNL